MKTSVRFLRPSHLISRGDFQYMLSLGLLRLLQRPVLCGRHADPQQAGHGQKSLENGHPTIS